MLDLSQFTEQVNNHLPTTIQFTSEELSKLYDLYKGYKYLLIKVQQPYVDEKKAAYNMFKAEARDKLIMLRINLAYDCPPGYFCPQDCPYDLIVVDTEAHEAWSYKDLLHTRHRS